MGDCSKLAPIGTWQNITPPGSWPKAVNGTNAAAIIVDPFDPRRLWLGTGSVNEEIWRSDDCGGAWTRVNIGPGSNGDKKTYGGVADGAQWSMMADYVDHNVLYAVSGYGAQSLWKTVDGGYSWTDVLAGTEYNRVAEYRFVNNVSMDATNHLHLVVSTHGGCAEPYTPTCLAETLDGGKNWRMVTGPEGWFEGGGIVIVQGGTWVWCGFQLMVTEDAGKTWQRNKLAGGGSCEAEYTIKPLERGPNGKYYLGSRNGVIRSSDGVNWEHVPNTNGNMVMMAQGSTQIFAADQWSPSIRTATFANDQSWTALPTPPQITQGVDGGIPFLAYDDKQNILYASMFSGGVARMRVK